MSSVRQSAGIKGAGGKGIGGQFKAHEASEPGFSLEGLTRHQPGPTPEMSQAAARRSRAQAAAAVSLLGSYPDVVAARFVDIGTKDLTAPGGLSMPNPDYVDQSDVPASAFRRFELRDVLLADGTVADESNQPQFTDKPGVRKLADNFQDHADLVFDPQDFHGNHVDELYKDHVNNQHVYFHQMVKDAAPRPLGIDRWGSYYDTGTKGFVSDPTAEEKKALGGHTPEAAAMELADELIKKFGRKEALSMANPARGQLSRHRRLQEAIENTPRSWNPFRRR